MTTTLRDDIIIRCLHCGTKNRIFRNRIHDKPTCGKCKEPLDEMIIRCLHCGTKNRMFEERLDAHPRCGRCGAPLVVSFEAGRPVEVTDAVFAAEVILAKEPVVVLCWAPWCVHCRTILPVFEQLATKYAGTAIKMAKLNLDENPLTAGQYEIMSVPTMLLFKEGRLINRLLGALPKAEIERHLLAMLKKN